MSVILHLFLLSLLFSLMLMILPFLILSLLLFVMQKYVCTCHVLVVIVVCVVLFVNSKTVVRQVVLVFICDSRLRRCWSGQWCYCCYCDFLCLVFKLLQLFTLLFAVLVVVYYLVCCWSGCLHLGLLLLFFTPLFAYASVSGANTKRSNLVMIETKSHKFRGHDFNSNPLQPSSDSLTLLVETSLHI